MPALICINLSARYDEHAVKMLSLEDITASVNNTVTKLYIVPRYLHFTWPAVEVGHITTPTNPALDIKLTLETLSTAPRVFGITNFLTAEECDFLFENNKDAVERSQVGILGGVNDNTRTSSTTWDGHSAVSQRIQKRAFALMGVDFDRGLADAIQILNYKKTQW
jgi:hypothetical protein